MKEETAMEDNQTPNDDIRVGVYVCHCGGNISDVVNTAEVAEAMKKNPHVKVAKDFVFMCSDPGQKLIIDDILENGINRVVVSACSPTLHELTFRKALERAGLNPYLFEHINVREQVSWVHKGYHNDATQKAIRLTMAGVEKVILQDPLLPNSVPAEDRVLVIGAGVSGLRAAIASAGAGLNVTVVERAEKAGGRVPDLGVIYPSNGTGAEIVNALLEDVKKYPAITLLLHSEIDVIEGFVGNFTARIRNIANGETTAVRAGAIILATGYDNYVPAEGEFGFNQSPDVITLPDFLNLIQSQNKGAREFVHNGKTIRNIGFIHCVGSRQVEGIHPPQKDGKVNDYCSRVCCTATLNAIHLMLDRFPDINVYDLYRDIRTYGHGHEDYYDRASQRGVLFFRYTEDGLPEFVADKSGRGGLLNFTDTLSYNEDVSIPVDMVVLATGIMPRDISNIISMLKLPVGADRFLQEVHPKLRPVELANQGVLIAGTCQSPMDIGESISAASATATRAKILLSHPTIELDPFVARVDENRCDGCALCLDECEYSGALTMTEIDGERKAVVNPAICTGCGACAAVCPPRAIQVAGWTIDQFDAMVDAITAA
jgi:heterodisulfide reductase subunit A